MPQQKLAEFGGMLPAWSDMLLPVNQATFSRNCYLYSGALNGWRLPKLLRTLQNSAAAFVYRIPTQSSSIASANLVFLANPNEGDTVLVGEVTYKFTADVDAPYDVLLEANSTLTSNNLFFALTQGATDGIVCGLGTVPNPAISPQAQYIGQPTSDTGSTYASGANVLILQQVTPAGTQNLTDISMMVQATHPSANFTGVLYNDNGQGAPAALIATGNQVTGSVAGTAVVSTFSVPPIVQGGSTYWIGFILDTSTTIQVANAGVLGNTANNTYSSGAPGVAPTMTTGVDTLQIWADCRTIQPTDPQNTIGVHSFGVGTRPIISLLAPSFGASYNLVAVAESTSGARLTWLGNPLSTATTPEVSTFSGGANQTEDTSIGGSSVWLEFLDINTDVVKSPVVDDSYQRFYFASPSQPPQYNTYDRIVASQPPWLLGVPAPGCAPGVTATGGGNITTVGLSTSSTTNNSSPGANSLFLIPITVTGALQLNDVNFMPAGTDANGHFSAVVYSDNNGSPENLLSIGVEQTGATAGTAVSSPFEIPFGLLTDLTYWIGFITDSGVSVQWADLTGSTGVSIANTYSSGAPNPAPAMNTLKPDWQIWSDATTSAVLEARAYVYTWVTQYGEEGPPSPPTTVTAWSNSSWAISLFTPTPNELGVTRNIKTTRLYRTVSGTTGQTSFFFVAEFDVTSEEYTDTALDTVIAANAILPSINWTPPPFDLQGITKMPNGMLAGFRANEVWFCEAYRPHAWPATYVMTVEFPIVGLGVTGQTLAVCTAGHPTVIFGVNPASVQQVDIKLPEPCISRGSIVSSDAGGVLYQSPNGLIQVTSGNTASNITEQWITRERWKALTPQKFLRALRLTTAYFAFGSVQNGDPSVSQQGFTIDLTAEDQSSFSILPQPGGHRIGFNTLTAPNTQNTVNLQLDPWTGIGLLLQNGGVYYYDFTDTAPTMQPYLWRSRIFQQGSKHNFEAMKLFFDIPPGTPCPNTPRQEPESDECIPVATPQITLQPTTYAIVRVYADVRPPDQQSGETVLSIVTEREVRSSGELLRIASGFKTEYWQFEVEARVVVSNLQVATSVKELARI